VCIDLCLSCTEICKFKLVLIVWCPLGYKTICVPFCRGGQSCRRICCVAFVFGQNSTPGVCSALKMLCTGKLKRDDLLKRLLKFTGAGMLKSTAWSSIPPPTICMCRYLCMFLLFSRCSGRAKWPRAEFSWVFSIPKGLWAEFSRAKWPRSHLEVTSKWLRAKFSWAKWPRSDLEPSFLERSSLEARSLKFSRCSGRAKGPRSLKSLVFSMFWASQVASKPEVFSFLDVFETRKFQKLQVPWMNEQFLLNIYIYIHTIYIYIIAYQIAYQIEVSATTRGGQAS
jgi:hypothetical protein